MERSVAVRHGRNKNTNIYHDVGKMDECMDNKIASIVRLKIVYDVYEYKPIDCRENKRFERIFEGLFDCIHAFWLWDFRSAQVSHCTCPAAWTQRILRLLRHQPAILLEKKWLGRANCRCPRVMVLAMESMKGSKGVFFVHLDLFILVRKVFQQLLMFVTSDLAPCATPFTG